MSSVYNSGSADDDPAEHRLHRLQDILQEMPREHRAPLRAGGLLRHVRGVQAATEGKVSAQQTAIYFICARTKAFILHYTE